jgi:serpin B
MHGVIESGYAKGPGWQAVDVPYIGGASMTLIVPDAGTFDQFERALDPTQLAHIIGSLSEAHGTLAMPKVQLDDKSDLGPMLEKLGMTDAFTGNADFSGITGNRDLSISQIVHEAKVTVDEKGTEAAAATAVGLYASATRISRATYTLDVNRPYLMLIRDDKTGAILFLGRVTDPTQTQVQQ